MISVKKSSEAMPEKLSLGFDLGLQRKLLGEKNLHKFASSVYRDSVIIDLNKIYRNKCGYCETDTTAGAALRVDHYRPKNGVLDDPCHLGYYWLGYEWTNLILSCEKCNRYKSNYFPVGGKRLQNPILNKDGTLHKPSLKSTSKLLLEEDPHILNPEIDKIRSHLTFLNDGTAVGLSSKGKETIDKCKLNRQELVLKRKKLIDTQYNQLRKILLHFIVSSDEKIFVNSIRIFFTELKSLQNVNNVYSEVGYLLYSNFDFFFVQKFHVKYRPELHILFAKFKSNNL